MGEKQNKPFQLSFKRFVESRFPRIACHFRRRLIWFGSWTNGSGSGS